MRPGLFLALLLASTLSSCASFTWRRYIVQQALPQEVLETLPQSGLELQQCLDLLGAPTVVREYEEEGLVLAWSWIRQRDLAASVSVPVTDYQSASFSYTDIRNKENGVVLWFDAQRRLTDWRSGNVDQLIDRRPRPNFVE